MIEVHRTVTVIVTTTVSKHPESTQAFLNILQSRNVHSQDALEVNKYHTVASFSCNPDYKLCMWWLLFPNTTYHFIPSVLNNL